MPVALMADHHPADRGVVGSVAASREVIVPELIGGDCGCGVFAAALTVSSDHLDRQRLTNLHTRIVSTIPVGRTQHRVEEDLPHLQTIWMILSAAEAVKERDIRKLRRQMGTLGGGNHFLELAEDETGRLWILVHSGSRYLGGIIRSHYDGTALEMGSGDAEEFMAIHSAALTFAAASRRLMAERALEQLRIVAPEQQWKFGETIDLPHNFIEVHEGSALHRKGSCSAYDGQPGIIPGSMGTASYIVLGRGACDGYWSSSHGSGRRLSRGEAFRTVSGPRLRREMHGIVWNESERLRDEAPSVYKNIDEVIREQHALVSVRHRLTPLLSVKGEC